MGGWFSKFNEELLLKACEMDDIQNGKAALSKIFSNPNIPVGKVDEIKNDQGETCLMVASKYGALKMLRFLVMHGKASPNTKHLTNGQISLHFACNFGKTELISHLLDFGADPTVI